jgi:hypothetical protein
MKLLITHIVFSLFILGTSLSAQEIVLPDQVFTIKVVEKNGNGKTESMPIDELVFKANQISADFSSKNGFPPANYSAVADLSAGPAAVSFTGQSDNSKKHTLKWTGTINGNKIQGKAQHYYFGQIAGEYIFNGTLKKKK